MIFQAQQLRHWSHSIEPDYPGIAQTMRDGAREIERLTTEVDDLRSCAHGAIMDDYRATLSVLAEAGYSQGGGTLAGRVKAFIETLTKKRVEAEEECHRLADELKECERELDATGRQLRDAYREMP